MRIATDFPPSRGTLAFVVCVLSALCLAPDAGAQPRRDGPPCAHYPSVDLDQGWDDSQREDFWFESQGSRIMPYHWFIALEQEKSRELLVDPCFMERLGFIAVPGRKLPIGFAMDKNLARTASYVGLTCSACHTARLNIGGEWAIVEGGPALIDFSGFLDALVASIEATLGDGPNPKFDRWVDRVNDTSQTPAQLRAGLAAWGEKLAIRKAQNSPKNPYGYGRVDAFGHIFNRVFETAIAADGNAREPDAPVSYPFLWDTPRGMHENVQWNWSARNREGPFGAFPGDLFRNLGELLGVFGTFDLTRQDTCWTFPCYKTASYQRAKLEKLEDLVKELRSPLWPSHLPGMRIDPAQVTKGREVYRRTCIRCHKLIDPSRVDPRRDAHDELIPLGVDPEHPTEPPLDTDSRMTDNYNRRLFEDELGTGIVRGRRISPEYQLGFERFGDVSNGHRILSHVVFGVFLGNGRHDSTALKAEAVGREAPPKGYKARSLNGIWATAPYLHNGSVPNLRTLLERDRGTAGFWVGSDTFDPVKVGLSVERGARSSWFDLTKDGNLNTGHYFGVDLSVEEKEALVEYLKTL